jgi:hypothetical protein
MFPVPWIPQVLENSVANRSTQRTMIRFIWQTQMILGPILPSAGLHCFNA